ncbi:hypothetical protein CA13_10590 [Planctomycetes bacterium CA13]|uniref:Uncharacterized protein n=1 Tax=Novipirellula herctigrandis TaxID=2527986 RepID=A0A5C5YZ25_9BACT|nr:hypothetical protein CA13_10590 [Planctomycetes bacterium CA13]
MILTEGREPSGLAMISPLRVLGDAFRYSTDSLLH